MDEFSLYVLDITMNSVRAGATLIRVTLTEAGDWLDFSVEDNGCGMTAEQIAKLSDPFFTTRKTRRVGLGIPFLKMLAEMTGGGVSVLSRTADAPSDAESGAAHPTSPRRCEKAHGTLVHARFGRHHIDFLPLGDMAETFVTLIQGAPDRDFIFRHSRDGKEVFLSTEEIRAVLGEGISLAEPEILSWIRENLREQYAALPD